MGRIRALWLAGAVESHRPSRLRSRNALLAAIACAVAASLVLGWLVLAGYEPFAGLARPAPAAYAGRTLHPTPQRITGEGGRLDLSGRVTVVAPDADPVARQALEALLRDLARDVVTTSSAPDDGGEPGTVVHLGPPGGAGGLDAALKGLQSRADGGFRSEALGRDEGYVIATGMFEERPTAVLAGADVRGQFYAVQSLRRLLDGAVLAPVSVADWPLMGTRGVIEGFYGLPWTPEARSAVLDAMGQSKMNTYIYSPKDDPYARERWREPYPDDGLAELRALLSDAGRNHIAVSYALSPGLSICYSADADLDAAVRKLRPLYDLGIRSVVIPLDDIGGSLSCAQDRGSFTAGGQASLAQAQAFFLNRLRDRLEAELPGLEPLQMVPTNYSGSASDPYKAQLGRDLDARIVVQWTGEEVVSHRITTDQAERARAAYGAPGKPRTVVVWDNFPVNDFSQDHLFLAPPEGRAPDLHKHVAGMVSNPLIQPYAALPGVAAYGDMLWNGPAYRPYESLGAALEDLAAGDAEALEALEAFTDLNQNWQLDDLPHPAPGLSRDVEEFWAAYRSGRPAPAALGERAAVLQRLPELLPRLREPGYAMDVAAWSGAAASYGEAIGAALRMLEATRDGDAAAAQEARSELLAAQQAAVAPAQPTLRLGLVVPVTGDGVVQEFLEEALDEFDESGLAA